MGFQRQLCEFEKLLSLKKSYQSPNRIDKGKVTIGHFLNTNGSKTTQRKDESILRSLSIIKGPAGAASSQMPIDPGQTISANFFSQEMP